MDEDTRLAKVKTLLKELSTYNDEEIKLWISAVMDFMEGAGVTPVKLQSEASIGLIALGVDALRMREPFSETFIMLVTQYALRGD